MSLYKHFLKLIPITGILFLLIFDANTAMNSAREGLNICIQTVIPSLFPFLFLSSLLTASLTLPCNKHSRFLCRLYRIPYGTESILFSGFLSGYPIGAKCVADATAQIGLSPRDAERMIVFCNATGPAFLFGITSSIFTQKWAPWCLWFIHLLSGIYVARLFPPTSRDLPSMPKPKPKAITQQLQQAIRTMGEICGWIILMRIATSVALKICLWRLPQTLVIFLSGVLEISNGCLMLTQVENMGLRFILCAIFLNFGGLCVALQTQSVAARTRQQMYIPGKCIQAIIGLIVAYLIQIFAFPKEEQVHLPFVFFPALALICIHFVYSHFRLKKSCGNF